MNRARCLGIAQELACVVWTALAAWTFLPGGRGFAAVPIALLAGVGALIGVLASRRAGADEDGDPRHLASRGTQENVPVMNLRKWAQPPAVAADNQERRQPASSRRAQTSIKPTRQIIP